MSLELFELNGLGVGLTGGGGYLGSAMVKGLVQSGAIVFACDINENSLARLKENLAHEEQNGRLFTITADINDEEQRASVLDMVEKEAGSVYGWVNNAYAGQAGLITEASRGQIEATVVGGLARVIEITRDVAMRMMPHRSGSIVNVSSMYGIVSPQPQAYSDHPAFHNPPAYGAAKAGVIQYTRYAACHLAAHGIRVNALSPGPFPKQSVRCTPGFKEQLSSRVPLGRLGEPEELVGAVIYLLSRASSYVTGHNLVVDGGWTAW